MDGDGVPEEGAKRLKVLDSLEDKQADRIVSWTEEDDLW